MTCITSGYTDLVILFASALIFAGSIVLASAMNAASYHLSEIMRDRDINKEQENVFAMGQLPLMHAMACFAEKMESDDPGDIKAAVAEMNRIQKRLSETSFTGDNADKAKRVAIAKLREMTESAFPELCKTEQFGTDTECDHQGDQRESSATMKKNT